MKRILVVSTTGMGDSLWGTPALRALKKSFPESRIDLMLDARWKPLFLGNPHIHRILDYRSQWYRQIGLSLQFARKRYETILIFHANKDIRRILMWNRGAEVFANQGFPWVPPDRRNDLPGSIHGIQRRLTLIKKIGARAGRPEMEIFFTSAEQKAAAEAMDRLGLSEKEYIYINLGCSAAERRWPDARFAELARTILESTPFRIVFGGGPAESALAEKISAGMEPGRTATSCGLPLKLDSYVLSRSRLLVSCNTGAMHIGFATRVPTVALLMNTDPLQSGPYQLDANRVAVLEPHAGSSGGRQDINSGRVWEAVQNMLAG